MTDDIHAYPARPIRSGWLHYPESARRASTHLNQGQRETHVYERGHLRLLSSAIVADYQGTLCAQNHVSVSCHPSLRRRPTDEEMAQVRRDFDMEDAEEDNHSPGKARHLFLPLHLPRGTTGVCDCKDDETVMVEADGYTWSKERR